MTFIKSRSIDSRNEQSPKITSKICPTDSCLVQLVEHWPYEPEVLVSIPTGGNFWRIFLGSSLCKDLSDMSVYRENSIVFSGWHLGNFYFVQAKRISSFSRYRISTWIYWSSTNEHSIYLLSPYCKMYEHKLTFTNNTKDCILLTRKRIINGQWWRFFGICVRVQCCISVQECKRQK